MNTPYENFKSLDNAKDFLKVGITFKTMNQIAYEITDNQSVDLLQQARSELLITIDERDFKISQMKSLKNKDRRTHNQVSLILEIALKVSSFAYGIWIRL